jgi:hypothetical protein
VIRRLFRSFSFAALLAAASLLGAAGQADAAEVVNGNFEAGSFVGWGVNDLTGLNRWTVADRKPVEEEFQFAFPAGTADHVALTEYNGADTTILSQELQLPAASNITLSLYLFYESAAAIAVPSPNTLFVTPKAEGNATPTNQQVRVDILKSNAPLESVSPNDILATPYASQNGDPEKVDPKLVTADLSAFAGQTVRLRIAAAVEDGAMEAGVANVSLATTPLALPSPITEPIAQPLTALLPGKLVRNRAAGSGILSITLPGPGTLTVSDARRKVAVASAYADGATKATSKSAPILIRTATAQTTGPQTVRVPIRPTAAARKLLRRSGRLPFHLQLTYAPASGTATSGTVATESYRGTLLKRLRPARR